MAGQKRPQPERISSIEEKPFEINSETKFTLTVNQVLASGASLLGFVMIASWYTISSYNEIKFDVRQLDSSYVDLNRKLEVSSVSSDRFRKLELELDALKTSNTELRKKVFR